MSSEGSVCLTKEQEKLLKSLEEEFKDRYTEKDEGFLATLKAPLTMPPVIENWFDFSCGGRKRNRDDQERNRYVKRTKMSSEGSVCLTEEQEKLLKSLEEEFKDRYTEKDEGFLATLKAPLTMPPVIENWFNFRYRGRKWYRDDQERNRYGNPYRYRDWNDHHSQKRWH